MVIQSTVLLILLFFPTRLHVHGTAEDVLGRTLENICTQQKEEKRGNEGLDVLRGIRVFVGERPERQIGILNLFVQAS